MAKYSEIVASENRSLVQQVSVLNELLSNKDQDLSSLYTDLSRKQSLLSAQSTDLLVLDSLKSGLDSEKRLRIQALKELHEANEL
jgi:hypothetical protein